MVGPPYLANDPKMNYIARFVSIRDAINFEMTVFRTGAVPHVTVADSICIRDGICIRRLNYWNWLCEVHEASQARVDEYLKRRVPPYGGYDRVAFSDFMQHCVEAAVQGLEMPWGPGEMGPYKAGYPWRR